MVMFNTSVTCCEHIRIANLPLLYPLTQTSLCVKEKIIKLRVSLNLALQESIAYTPSGTDEQNWA